MSPPSDPGRGDWNWPGCPKAQFIPVFQTVMLNAKRCLSLLLLLAASGCGPSGPDIASVEGLVTLDGKPLPGAQVLFVPDKGRPSVAKTNAEGKYRLEYVDGLEGAIPGKCRVEITTRQPAERNAQGEMMPAVKEMVPVQYNRDTTLQFEVKADTANVANFDLESKGKVSNEKVD